MTALNTQSDEYFFVERFARFDPDEVLILKYLRKQTISLRARGKWEEECKQTVSCERGNREDEEMQSLY
jgi:hypothetical protein